MLKLVSLGLETQVEISAISSVLMAAVFGNIERCVGMCLQADGV